jgi:hypothetical protein
MRVLIIDQCSGSKEVPPNAPSFDAEEIDNSGREALLARDDVPRRPARRLYTGRQQQYIDSAVDQLRAAGDSVDRVYVSAGFGLVEEETELPPYNVTFAEMAADAIDERAQRLGIPEAVRSRLTTDRYDIVVFALGRDYYRACELEQALNELAPATLGVVFNSESVAEAHENVISISARSAEAKEYGTIVVALKGVYLQNLAANRAAGRQIDDSAELRESLETEPTTQTGLGEYE